MAQHIERRNVLTIDIGGSGIKATVLNQHEEMLVPRNRVNTPADSTPENVLEAIEEVIKDFPECDRVAVGFPGYVRNGVIHTAPNLGTKDWSGIKLGQNIADLTGKPTRLVNDADLLGMGVISGDGLELMITLGTGLGTALFMDGHLMPHLEFAHHPVKNGDDYDKYIGKATFKDIGVKKWNKRIKKVLKILKTIFNYDTLYIGGGNSDKINFELDSNIFIVSNHQGIRGGIGLWRIDEDDLCVNTLMPKQIKHSAN